MTTTGVNEEMPEMPLPKSEQANSGDVEGGGGGGGGGGEPEVKQSSQSNQSKDTTSEVTTSSSLMANMKASIMNPYEAEALATDKEGEPEEEEEMEQALSEDIYSLMSTVPACSMSFGFAVFVFLVQFLIIVLVLLDLVDTTSNPRKSNGIVNRMGIPADTPNTVRAAQFLGCLLIINFGAGQGDLLEGFSHLLNGYDPHIIDTEPYATKFKWYMAGVCQFLVGVGLTVDLFVLMMQSTSNIILCLNFAALHFVQDIDDVAFTMGSMGLITRRVQKDCNHAGDIMIHATKSRKNDIIKRIFLVVLGIILYVAFFVIASWQWTGRFMCHTVYVQFGDVHGPEWSYYSGLFDTVGHHIGQRIEDRPVYLDAMTQTIRLAYCSGEEAWTFSNVTETDDHCNYFIKSSTTTGYDIMSVAENIWYALDKDLGDVPMEYLLVECNDCDQFICAPDVGTCSEDNRCVCNEDRMGINCEFKFEDVCDFMALDRRSKSSLSSLPFAALFTRKEYRQYSLSSPHTGTINQIYDRPFYVSIITVDEVPYVDVFIIYSGYRWIIYGVPQEYITNTTLEQFDSYLIDNDPNLNDLQTLSTISSDALPYFQPLFFSSPVKFETESHEVDPINVQWVLAEEDETLLQVGFYADANHEVSASFLCSKCDNDTPCFNGGVCNEKTTICNCTNPKTGVQSYGGNMCEYAFSCIEFQAREDRLLNGCKCDPVFGICTTSTME